MSQCKTECRIDLSICMCRFVDINVSLGFFMSIKKNALKLALNSHTFVKYLLARVIIAFVTIYNTRRDTTLGQ